MPRRSARPPRRVRLDEFAYSAAAEPRRARPEAAAIHRDHLVGVVALEDDRLDGGAEPVGIGDSDNAATREQRRLVGRLAALLDAIPRDDHSRRRRRAGYAREVAVAREDHDIGAAHVLPDLGDARKLLCNLYTFTDYTYLFTHEFSAREEE